MSVLPSTLLRKRFPQIPCGRTQLAAGTDTPGCPELYKQASRARCVEQPSKDASPRSLL